MRSRWQTLLKHVDGCFVAVGTLFAAAVGLCRITGSCARKLVGEDLVESLGEFNRNRLYFRAPTHRRLQWNKAMHAIRQHLTFALLFICVPVTAQEWPDTSASWEVVQYKVVLEQLSRFPPTELPRLSDDEFDKVFACVIDRGRFLSLLQSDAAVEIQLQRCMEIMQVITEINRRYVLAFVRDESYSRESIRLLGFMLFATKQQLLVFDEFAKTLDKADPTYPSRMVGIAQMRFGVSQMMLGALHCIEETDIYSVDERRKLAVTISETFPAFTTKIDRDVSDALTFLKDRISKADPDPGIRNALSNKQRSKR